MKSHAGALVLVCMCLYASLCGVSFAQNKPAIVLQKLVAKLYQHESAMKLLFEASCLTDPPDRPCSIGIRYVLPSHPCGNCFIALPGCNAYCVWFMPGQGYLNPDVEPGPGYFLILEAEDVDGLVSRRLVNVRITTNSPPYFDHGGASFMTEEIFNSEALRAGQVVATVSALDDDGDSLIFTMSTVPDIDEIVINSLSGAISITRDMRAMCMFCVSCLVYVQDNYNSPVGPFVVNLEFQDNNFPPVITNLNVDLYVREDEAVDRTILPLNVYDDIAYPDVIYTVSTVPPSMADFFHVKLNNLKVKQALDYETQPHVITMYIRATDGFCDSEIYTLNIRLVDVNEPPILLPVEQTITTCEGWVDIVHIWNASDPDEGDSWSFTDVQPNTFGRFKVHDQSGLLSTTLNYDLDEAKHPSSATLTVTLSDQQLLTATAIVSVYFIDCNDNAPVFPKGAKVVKTTPCDSVATIIGVVPKASDVDSDFRQNNVITYAGSGGLVTVHLDGNIVLTGVFHQGQYVTFPVYATDKGEYPRPLTSSNPVWISVYAEPCPDPPATDPPTTTTAVTSPTTTAPNASDTWDENEGWIIAAAMAAGVLALLALFMFVRYGWSRCRQSCRGPQSKKGKVAKPRGHRGGGDGKGKRPPSPEPERRNPVGKPPPISDQQDAGSRPAWSDNPAGNDHPKPPNHPALPEPSQGVDSVYPYTYNTDIN